MQQDASRVVGPRAGGVVYEKRSCLDEPPTREEVRDVLRRLRAGPWDIARAVESREAGFGDLPRDAAHREDRGAQPGAHPPVVQRPIILLDDGTAVVERDAAALDRILGA